MTTTAEQQQHTLHVMDNTGDTQLTWASNRPAEVDAARDMFDRLRDDGYLAYRVDPADGSKGEKITEFDPTAQAIVMSPQLVGG